MRIFGLEVSRVKPPEEIIATVPFITPETPPDLVEAIQASWQRTKEIKLYAIAVEAARVAEKGGLDRRRIARAFTEVALDFVKGDVGKNLTPP